MTIRLIDAGRVSALRSQTIYHALAYAKTNTSPDTIVLSTPGEPYVCTGFHRSPDQEVDLEYCRINRLPIIRRETGGGTVYIDDRQLFVQWIFEPDHLPRKIDNRFRLFCRPLIETYQFFGINAVFFPPNDVHVRQRKIVGTGAASIGNAEVVTGNFLFDFDPAPMAGLLNVPGGRFREMVLEGMKKYMSSFRRELQNAPLPDEVKKIYLQKCSTALDAELEPGEFTDTERRIMTELDGKFSSPDWLFEHSAGVSGLRRVKIHADVWVSETTLQTENGPLVIQLRTKGNRIDDIAFSGNVGLQPADRLSGLENALKQVELAANPLREILEAFFELHRAQTPERSIENWVEALLKCRV